MASTSRAVLLVEYKGRSIAVARQASLLASIRSALRDFDLPKADARDYEFTSFFGEVEATVGQSVFEAEEENKAFRVKLQRKGDILVTVVHHDREDGEVKANVFSMQKSTRIGKLYQAVALQLGMDEESFYLCSDDGDELCEEETMTQLKIADGDTLELIVKEPGKLSGLNARCV